MLDLSKELTWLIIQLYFAKKNNEALRQSAYRSLSRHNIEKTEANSRKFKTKPLTKTKPLYSSWTREIGPVGEEKSMVEMQRICGTGRC